MGAGVVERFNSVCLTYRMMGKRYRLMVETSEPICIGRPHRSTHTHAKFGGCWKTPTGGN